MTILERLFPDMSPYLPGINRCRDYHLYAGGGNRFLDMYLAGGTALLGYRPGGLSLNVKNTIARGLWAGYPSPWTGRLKKELNRLLPDFPEVMIFSGYLEAELWLKEKFPGKEIQDPAVCSSKERISDSPSLWRPFCPPKFTGMSGGADRKETGFNESGASADVPVLMPILPFPGSFLPGILCCRPGTASAEELERYRGGTAPPVLMAGLVRAAALIRGLSDDTGRQRPAGSGYTSGAGAPGKKSGGEIHPGRRNLSLPDWERRGPYLRFRGDPETYDEYFQAALNHRILLPPNRSLPAIIPGIYSSGEIAPLIKIFDPAG